MPPTQPLCPTPAITPHGEVLDLGYLVAEMVSGLSASTLSHTLKFSGEVECPIWGERAALRRLVRSLIWYAVAHSASGRAVEVEVWRHGSSVCLVVEDEGLGQPPAPTDRLFRPFTRLNSVEQIIQDFGAELAVTHRIAATHDATLAVQGTPGQGTTFEVCFPLFQEPEQLLSRDSVP